jgi:hypothetical protein
MLVFYVIDSEINMGIIKNLLLITPNTRGIEIRAGRENGKQEKNQK